MMRTKVQLERSRAFIPQKQNPHLTETDLSFHRYKAFSSQNRPDRWDIQAAARTPSSLFTEKRRGKQTACNPPAACSPRTADESGHSK
ncbi:hypothetical protein JCM6292_2299 [Bacteroides pyogenes JCM 6292]|uniref:Uncharacterized protein n=1 Tax=Bacteroides pyogenes JCM 6292 TaxID=1235809 RepID=W4P896_9BACE|nr:hypothetical protein JCM6292_2299 [Bacteroides pyogenes JCM 6292]